MARQLWHRYELGMEISQLATGEEHAFNREESDLSSSRQALDSINRFDHPPGDE